MSVRVGIKAYITFRFNDGIHSRIDNINNLIAIYFQPCISEELTSAHHYHHIQWNRHCSISSLFFWLLDFHILANNEVKRDGNFVDTAWQLIRMLKRFQFIIARTPFNGHNFIHFFLKFSCMTVLEVLNTHCSLSLSLSLCLYCSESPNRKKNKKRQKLTKKMNENEKYTHIHSSHFTLY